MDLGTSVLPLLNNLQRQFLTRDREAYINWLQDCLCWTKYYQASGRKQKNSAATEENPAQSLKQCENKINERRRVATWRSQKRLQVSLGGGIRSRHDGITQSLQGNKTQATIYICTGGHGQVTKPVPMKGLGVRTEVKRTTMSVRRRIKYETDRYHEVKNRKKLTSWPFIINILIK